MNYEMRLAELRAAIEQCDQKLVAAWQERMDIAAKIGALKVEHGLAITDTEREEKLWLKWQKKYSADDLDVMLFLTALSSSKLRQRRTADAYAGNLYLLGMPGSGKSRIGRLVAQRLGCVFFDMDAALEAIYGCSIAEMFAMGGEQLFRSRETALLLMIAQHMSGTVVATGGGVVLSLYNRTLLKASGTAVLLRLSSPPNDATFADNSRPLCRDSATWRDLSDERESLYNDCAAQVFCADDTEAAVQSVVSYASLWLRRKS